MRILLFLISLFFVLNLNAQRGTYITDTFRLHMTIPEIEQLYIDNDFPPALLDFLPTVHEIDLYKIVYETISVFGEPTIASGLVAIPSDYTCPMAMVVYNHGTTRDTDQSELEGEWIVSVPIATDGFIAVLPDYLGYGQSQCTDFHGYAMAKPLATDNVDIIRAVRTMILSKGKSLNFQTFITGYSEGGIAAMAACKEIQENHSNEILITAAAPSSGPYIVYPLTFNFYVSPESDNAGNLSYIFYAFNNVYDIADELTDVLVPPYGEAVPQIWDECNPTMGTNILPSDNAVQMVNPDYLAEVLADPNHPVINAFKENNVYDWAPNFPMRLYYCEADEQVPYENAIQTVDSMILNGAVNVEAISQGANNDHNACAPFALINAKKWFAELRIECEEDTTTNNDTTTMAIRQLDVELIETYPNPVDHWLNLNTINSSSRSLSIQVYNSIGNLKFDRVIQSGFQQIDMSRWPSGLYIVEMENEKGEKGFKKVIKN